MSVTPPNGYGIYTRSYKAINGTREAVNVFGFQNGTAGDAGVAIVAIRGAFVNALTPYAQSYLADTWEHTGDYCLVNQAGALTSIAGIGLGAGAAGQATPPPNVSCVVKKTTVLAGKQYRGRTAYPAGFLDETDINDMGIIDSGVLSTLQTRFSQLVSRCSAASTPLMLIHSEPKSGITPTPTAVQFMTPTQLVGTQRRRLR